MIPNDINFYFSETSVQTTQYGNEIEEKSIEKAKKRVQLITLSSKKSV